MASHWRAGPTQGAAGCLAVKLHLEVGEGAVHSVGLGEDTWYGAGGGVKVWREVGDGGRQQIECVGESERLGGGGSLKLGALRCAFLLHCCGGERTRDQMNDRMK